MSKSFDSVVINSKFRYYLAMYKYAYEEVYGKKRSVSSMVNEAVIDYVAKHRDEINETYRLCQEKYPWFKAYVEEGEQMITEDGDAST